MASAASAIASACSIPIRLKAPTPWPSARAAAMISAVCVTGIGDTSSFLTTLLSGSDDLDRRHEPLVIGPAECAGDRRGRGRGSERDGVPQRRWPVLAADQRVG